MALDILIEELEDSLWVASVEDKVIRGLEVDPASELIRWGSIYWAKVERIDAALDAAWVNLDGVNNALLHNADTRFMQRGGKIIKGGAEPISKRLKEGQMIAVQSKSGILPPSEEDEDDLPLETKTARVSMDITLQGRFMIYSPMSTENRLSTRIKDKKLRRQLLKMLNSIDDIKGCILRASAAYTQTDILIREGKILSSMWTEMQKHLEGDAPALIMEGPDAIQRTISDHAGRLVGRIDVTTMDVYQHTEEWCELFAPDLVTKIHPVEMENFMDDLALFDQRGVVDQIEDLFKPYALLPGGGNVIIQETAALVAVDINRGADAQSNLGLNIEAADVIARQIRLRNLGGVIVIDALKMKNKSEQKKLLDALQAAIDRDPCTVQIHGITALGLIELTRRRRTPRLHSRFLSALE